MNTNLNLAECVKSATGFFSTTYTNICDGTTQVVQNGSADIAIHAGYTLFLVSVVAVILSILYKTITDK